MQCPGGRATRVRLRPSDLEPRSRCSRRLLFRHQLQGMNRYNGRESCILLWLYTSSFLAELVQRASSTVLGCWKSLMYDDAGRCVQHEGSSTSGD
nr:hypothetical protein CFP56_19532 [Quercus suber]